MAWRGVSDGPEGWSVTVDCDFNDRVLCVAIWSPHGSEECSIPFDRTIGLRDLLIDVHGLPDAADLPINSESLPA